MLKTILLRGLWIMVLVIIIMTVPSVHFLFSAVSLGSAVPDHITLTWSGDPQTSQTITWRMDKYAKDGFVEYGESLATRPFPYDTRTVTSNVEKLSTNAGDMSIHSVTLNRLKPGTHYYYRVGYGNLWSNWYEFTTAPKNIPGFTFLIFGDSQSVNYNAWGATLHQAFQDNSQAAFFINAGNLVDVGQDFMQWNDWLEAAKGVIDTIPAMPVPGSHEIDHQISQPTLYTTLFKLPSNAPEHLKGKVYSFDYGEVHFIMLNQSYEKSPLSDIVNEEEAWLEQDLQNTNKKWKVVVSHQPLYKNEISATEDNKEDFVPIFDKYHVDIVFSGHEPIYARTHPLYNNEIVDQAALGTIYVTSGKSGTKNYQNSEAKPWDVVFYNPLGEPIYLTVEVQSSIMAVKAFTQQGFMIDAWAIEKLSDKKSVKDKNLKNKLVAF
jgi:hypothetical protein